jgi:hypothetical protein
VRGPRPGLADQEGRAFGEFFTLENLLIYAAVLGLILAALLHPYWLALVVPMLVWGMFAGGGTLSLPRLPKLLPRAILLGVRQAFMCAGLVYGSIRFRSLVL